MATGIVSDGLLSTAILPEYSLDSKRVDQLSGTFDTFDLRYPIPIVPPCKAYCGPVWDQMLRLGKLCLRFEVWNFGVIEFDQHILDHSFNKVVSWNDHVVTRIPFFSLANNSSLSTNKSMLTSIPLASLKSSRVVSPI